jgi:hypothetical protein
VTEEQSAPALSSERRATRSSILSRVSRMPHWQSQAPCPCAHSMRASPRTRSRDPHQHALLMLAHDVTECRGTPNMLTYLCSSHVLNAKHAHVLMWHWDAKTCNAKHARVLIGTPDMLMCSCGIVCLCVCGGRACRVPRLSTQRWIRNGTRVWMRSTQRYFPHPPLALIAFLLCVCVCVQVHFVCRCARVCMYPGVG